MAPRIWAGARPASLPRESSAIDPRPRSFPLARIDPELVSHVLILLALSFGFESLFLHYNLNGMDEGWPLHAAMEMHNGGTLYDEVFWVFPPGHVLPAWIGYHFAAPGILLTRMIYSSFTIANCLALYFVARKLMPSDFALLAGLLIAIAAPRSHWEHLLFGYRYLAWSALVLLCFHVYLSRERLRWLFVSGFFAGVGLFFRVTPAFAVSAAVGVGILAASRDWRRWLRAGLCFAAGLLLVWIPVLIWFHGTVGLERFFSEALIRPVEMTALQARPMPPLSLAQFDRANLMALFIAVAFRVYPILYLGFTLVLLTKWARAVRARRSFDSVFLLTFVLFGGIYFVRSMGRSDLPHLDSAIPPVFVVLAYLASLSTRNPAFQREASGSKATIRRALLCAGILGLSIYFNGPDLYLDQESTMGRTPIRILGGELKVTALGEAAIYDRLIEAVQEHSGPDDRILVMTNRPVIHVLAKRRSPGYFDVIMPGTFRTRSEERAFLDRIEADPPAVVVWPTRHFDHRRDRGLAATAPLLSGWISDHYRIVAKMPLYMVLVPDSVEADSSP